MMRLNSNATVREILTTGTLAALLDGALAAFYLLVILGLSPVLGLLVVVLGAAQVVVLLAARRRNQQLMGEALATEAQSQSYAYEMFAAVETLKAAGAERRAVSRWTNLFVAELNVSVSRGRLEAAVETAIHGLALLSPIAVLRGRGAPGGDRCSCRWAPCWAWLPCRPAFSNRLGSWSRPLASSIARQLPGPPQRCIRYADRNGWA